MATPNEQMDEKLRDIYERCDVSNNRTDKPMSFEEFEAAIKRLVLEGRIAELKQAAETRGAIGPVMAVPVDSLWKRIAALNSQIEGLEK